MAYAKAMPRFRYEKYPCVFCLIGRKIDGFHKFTDQRVIQQGVLERSREYVCIAVLSEMRQCPLYGLYLDSVILSAHT